MKNNVSVAIISDKSYYVTKAIKKDLIEVFKKYNITLTDVEFIESNVRKNKIYDEVNKHLSKLTSIGESIKRNDICQAIWNNSTYWTTRTFDTHFAYYKREHPDKKFIVRRGIITRIK